MSRQFPFYLVDAFAERPLAGNSCAVVCNAENLTSDEMLLIAKEMNQSETAFLLPSSEYDFKARYFTPEREIPLAGHPTLASTFVALSHGILPSPMPDQVSTTYSLELNEGPIRVDASQSDGHWSIKMFQRRPQFFDVHDPNHVLPLFGLSHEDLLEGFPIQTVSTGTKQLMILLKDFASLKKISVQSNTYKQYRERSQFFSPHLFCLKGISKDAKTFARHPGVPPDTGEDAFTGSATGAMAAYLWHHGIFEEESFIAEQGHWMGRPGRAKVERIGPANALESVSVSGCVMPVVSGVLTL